MEFKMNEAPQTVGAGDVEKITKAAQETKTIRITYTDSDGNITVRTVEPYEIKEGKLYAYCQSRQAIRAFKLDRFQSVEITDTTYSPRHPIKIGNQGI